MIVASVFLVYGTILYIEAGVGYRSNGERQTLIAGIVSGTILFVAAALVEFHMKEQIGASMGVGVTLAMLGNFGSRFRKSKTFMPAGLMLAVSVVALGILATQVFSN